jgi:hypothetical protein
VADLESKLAERVERYVGALNEQIGRADHERQRMEEGTRALMAAVESGLKEKIRGFEATVYEQQRQLSDSITGAQQRMDDGLSRLTAGLKDVDSLRNQGDAAVQSQVQSLQAQTQQGLVKLREEGNSQKGMLTTLVQTEIQNRVLNIESIEGVVERAELQREESEEELRSAVSAVKRAGEAQADRLAEQLAEAEQKLERLEQGSRAELAELKATLEAGERGFKAALAEAMADEQERNTAGLGRMDAALAGEEALRKDGDKANAAAAEAALQRAEAELGGKQEAAAQRCEAHLTRRLDEERSARLLATADGRQELDNLRAVMQEAMVQSLATAAAEIEQRVQLAESLGEQQTKAAVGRLAEAVKVDVLPLTKGFGDIQDGPGRLGRLSALSIFLCK